MYKQHFFRSVDRLELLQQHLFGRAEEYGWRLQSWAIFSNHYHFVALSPDDPSNLGRFIGHLHTLTTRAVNVEDGAETRKVWFQYWDTHLTFERSYLARLNYVHTNPVRHGLVAEAERYPWCSARWFSGTAPPAFARTVRSFKTDRVTVMDDYQPVAPDGWQ